MSENPKLLLDASGDPMDRVFGFETEYALGGKGTIVPLVLDDALSSDNMTVMRFDDSQPTRPADRYEVTELLARYYVRDNPSHFDRDGARRYIDVGNHPEYSTAEDNIIMDAAYRLLAGHVKTARDFQASAQQTMIDSQAGIKVSSVDLVANTITPDGDSWSSHENMLARRELEPIDYIVALAIHRLSRIVWSGAGFVQRLPDGDFDYYLSEKADHIWEVANSDTTKRRPLVNLRDEPLADLRLWRRVHNVTGETIFSPLGNALRLATDSLVLRACELGVSFDDLMPENPILAISQISHDPTLKQLVKLENGRKLTGIQLQQAVRARVIDNIGSYMTEQEKMYAREWGEVLAALEVDPLRCGKFIDWVVKQKLIERELDNRHDSNESRAAIAWLKATNYHRLLPFEGSGMRLLRSGFFDNSPTEEQLDGGMPLPNTRAKVRANIVQQIEDAGIEKKLYGVDWESFRIYDPDIHGVMRDPFSTELRDLGLR